MHMYSRMAARNFCIRGSEAIQAHNLHAVTLVNKNPFYDKASRRQHDGRVEILLLDSTRLHHPRIGCT